MNNDLISISEAKKLGANCLARRNENGQLEAIISLDNAPTVEYTFEEAFQKTVCEQRLYCPERPQGEYVDISKLRLMTVEECAGHTLDYAMGWKACVEWIKKGGTE